MTFIRWLSRIFDTVSRFRHFGTGAYTLGKHHVELYHVIHLVNKSYSIPFGTVFSVVMGGNFQSVKEAKLSKKRDTHLH